MLFSRFTSVEPWLHHKHCSAGDPAASTGRQWLSPLPLEPAVCERCKRISWERSLGGYQHPCAAPERQKLSPPGSMAVWDTLPQLTDLPPASRHRRESELPTETMSRFQTWLRCRGSGRSPKKRRSAPHPEHPEAEAALRPAPPREARHPADGAARRQRGRPAGGRGSLLQTPGAASRVDAPLGAGSLTGAIPLQCRRPGASPTTHGLSSTASSAPRARPLQLPASSSSSH